MSAVRARQGNHQGVVMDIAAFKERIKLDPEQLDVAALEQAELFFEWAALSAQARIKMDRAKHAMECLAASLAMQCRAKPAAFKIEKVTEIAVDNAVKQQEGYQQAMVAFLGAKEESLMLERAVEALEQRKRMLQTLVMLHGQSYFATPALGRNLTEAWDTQQTNLAKKQKALMEAKRTSRKDKV